ncbi:MAG TPA: aminotransferase class I/II-fold pyridoxal phosphate-dependent enzyme [Acidimicrobiia bacterium]|nr:aminotransferase class I/II-fold pyridoxal phosphate-dependent enzyme [Acidimicrobiia bacterium]
MPRPDIHPLPVDHVDTAARRRIGGLKWHLNGGDMLPAWVAEHDLGAPPAVAERLRELVDGGAFGYHTTGDEVGAAFARWAKTRHGWAADPDLIVPTANVLQGIWTCIEAFTDRDAAIVYSTPVYPPFLDAPPTTGRRAVDWPMVRTESGWRYDLDALEHLLEADPGIGLLLLCHPQNPTGLVFTEDQLVRIVELSDEHDLLVVSDEIHSDLVHPGSTHIPMLTIPGASSRTVTVTSGVKTFALGGLRCAVAVCGDERLHAGFSSVPAELRGGPNRMGCEATIAAWDTGSAWTDGLLALLDSHRHHLHERLAAELPEVAMFLPQSTFVAWLDMSAHEPGENPARWLRRLTGVACGNGPEFGPGGADHVRLTFGTSTELLDEMVDRIVAGLHG